MGFLSLLPASIPFLVLAFMTGREPIVVYVGIHAKLLAAIEAVLHFLTVSHLPLPAALSSFPNSTDCRQSTIPIWVD
jgi:hypothetical protein